eukprot:267755-Amphidinium_carterae.1
MFGVSSTSSACVPRRYAVKKDCCKLKNAVQRLPTHCCMRLLPTMSASHGAVPLTHRDFAGSIS